MAPRSLGGGGAQRKGRQSDERRRAHEIRRLRRVRGVWPCVGWTPGSDIYQQALRVRKAGRRILARFRKRHKDMVGDTDDADVSADDDSVEASGRGRPRAPVRWRRGLGEGPHRERLRAAELIHPRTRGGWGHATPFLWCAPACTDRVDAPR